MTIQRIQINATSKDVGVNLAIKSAEVEINRVIGQINQALASLVPASDTAIGLAEYADQPEMEAATDNEKAVVPGRVNFHPGVAKFWAVVTVSAGTHSLAASHNVASIIDGATGIFTLNIATDFSSADWCCIATAQGSGTSVTAAKVVSVSSKTAGSVVIATYDLADPPVLEDSVSISVVGFGDQ